MKPRLPLGVRACLVSCAALVLAIPVGAGVDSVEIVQAQTEIPQDQLLDVGIEVFDPGVPEGDPHALEEKGVFPDLRRSEARYIPFHLKDTLESTASWGAVRVIPRGAAGVDVRVSGRIVESNGMNLVLDVTVADSRGRTWLEKRYKGNADPAAYDEEDASHDVADPYQALYNTIANDMLADRLRLDSEDIADIRTLSELDFAAELVPSAFGGYLDVSRKGRVSARKLPAEDDPMMLRVDKVRERDDLFVDTLNEYYADFCLRMDGPYDSWRHFSYEEQLELQQIRRAARMRMFLGAFMIVGGMVQGGNVGDVAMVGGTLVVGSAIQKAQEGKIHRDALQELAYSFDAEMAPVLVDVEGQTLKLEGSAEAQFAEWRRLLGEIFASETGLPADPDAGGSSEPPSGANL
jgi:hypothetical protein